MSAPRQLAFDLPHRPAIGRADFLVSQSNAQAVAAIDAWPDWAHPELLLVGPPGSGKSHLVSVWRARSGARQVSAADLSTEALPSLLDAPALAVEDCGAMADERALFHLLNEARRTGTDILLTARARSGAWRLQLADLTSRLNRMPVVEVESPDDRLVEALLTKLFADRQIEVDGAVIRYLARRLERSFEALRSGVERLDRLAIEEQRPVTRALAARILSEGQPAGH